MFKKKPQENIESGALLPSAKEIVVVYQESFDLELQKRIMDSALFNSHYDGFYTDCLQFFGHYVEGVTLRQEIDLYDNDFKTAFSQSQYWALHTKHKYAGKSKATGFNKYATPYEDFIINPFCEWELMPSFGMRRNLILGYSGKNQSVVIMTLAAKREFKQEWQDWHYNGYPEKVIRIKHPYPVRSAISAGDNVRS